MYDALHASILQTVELTCFDYDQLLVEELRGAVTDEDKKFLTNLLTTFVRQTTTKYIKGKHEHKTNLLAKSRNSCLDELSFELMDAVVYLAASRQAKT